MHFVVTGANGFIGNACLAALRTRPEHSVVGTVRSSRRPAPGRVQVGDLGPGTDWTEALAGADVVIHTAARVHMNDKAPEAHAAHVRANFDGTLALARQAVSAGVRRFVFISSIGVNGQQTPVDEPFTASNPPQPEGSYALSKLLAEEGLLALAEETGLEVVIIRPPLVYGPRAPGNFAAMVRWVDAGIPLPLGSVSNKRSMVSIDNLVDLILVAAGHPAAPGHVFLAADGEDLSTSEWLRRLAAAMDKRSRLIPVPVRLLHFGATMLGKGATARRLLGSLQIDISAARTVLGWQPAHTVDESLARAVRG